MNPKFGREIALLCLPFLVIVGAALWKSRAPGSAVPAAPTYVLAPLPMSPMLSPSLSPSTLPLPVAQLKVGTVQLSRMGPVCSQNAWFDGDAQVSATLLVPTGPWLKPVVVAPPAPLIPAPLPNTSRVSPNFAAPPLAAPPFTTRPGTTMFSTGSGGFMITSRVPDAILGLRAANWDFLDGSGAILPVPDGASSGATPTVLMSSTRSTSSPSQSQSAVQGGTQSLPLVEERFDLDRVPASRGAIRLRGNLSFYGGAVQVQIPVRPAWFTRAPQSLKLSSAKWRSPANGDEGSVEIALNSGANPPLLLSPEPKGSSIAWQIAPSPPGIAGREVFPRRKLLYNWSPRLESADAQYNSHAAKDIKVWGSLRRPASSTNSSAANSRVSSPVQTHLANFWPKIWACNPVQNGGLIHLRFRFYGLHGFQGAPVFKTEIGVPGDGFLRVNFPLPGEGER